MVSEYEGHQWLYITSLSVSTHLWIYFQLSGSCLSNIFTHWQLPSSQDSTSWQKSLQELQTIQVFFQEIFNVFPASPVLRTLMGSLRPHVSKSFFFPPRNSGKKYLITIMIIENKNQVRCLHPHIAFNFIFSGHLWESTSLRPGKEQTQNPYGTCSLLSMALNNSELFIPNTLIFFFLKPCDDFSLLLGEQSHNERDHCLNLTCIFFVFMITWGLP